MSALIDVFKDFSGGIKRIPQNLKEIWQTQTHPDVEWTGLKAFAILGVMIGGLWLLNSRDSSGAKPNNNNTKIVAPELTPGK